MLGLWQAKWNSMQLSGESGGTVFRHGCLFFVQRTWLAKDSV